MTRTILGVLAALLFAPSALAANGDEVRIGVVDIRTPAGKSNDDSRALREALIKSFKKYRVDVVQDHEAVRGALGSGKDARYKAGLKRARSLLKDGRRLYKKFDSKGAEKKLRAAAKAYEKNAAGLRKPDELIQTYLLLAQVFFATKHERVARDVFIRVVQIRPDTSLDVTRYPPRMVKFYNAVKEEVVSGTLGSVEVVSIPGRSTVYLDGEKRGATTKKGLELVNLPPGVHTLVVRRTGYAPWVQRIDVTSFRSDTIEAELKIDRHPNTHLLGLKTELGEVQRIDKSVLDYLDAISRAADLDLLVVGTASPAPGGKQKLQVRLYRADGQTGTTLQTFEVNAKSEEQVDAVADGLLREAATKKWIPELAARRTVEAGGGALDETSAFRLQASIAPGYSLADESLNFPQGAAGGIRITFVRRLSSRFVLTAETGFEGTAERDVTLHDDAGNVIAGAAEGVTAIYTTVPLDVGLRWYMGVSNLAPYLALGGGGRFDMLDFREPLPRDEISAQGGFGWSAFAGTGLDWALGLDSGLFAEARVQLGGVGITEAQHRITGTSSTVENRLPVDAGNALGVRLFLGYLRVF